jgi:uncharacterized protein (DUF1330 family)
VDNRHDKTDLWIADFHRTAEWGIIHSLRPGPRHYGDRVTVYAIVLLSIHDRARYDRYVAAFMPVLRTYGGRLLAADDRPEVAEGQWSGDRVVLLGFPDRDTFTTWATSPEYREIVKDRYAAADAVVLLAQGVGSTG